MSVSSPHISVAAEPIAKLGNFQFIGDFLITNSMFATMVLTIVLCIFGIVVGGSLRFQGTKISKTQNFLEWFFDIVEGTTTDNLGSKSIARGYFGLSATIFLFIVLGSWIGLIPGVMHLIVPMEGFEHELVPLFRAPTTDLNATIAMAIIAFLTIQVAGFRALKLGYLGKFFVFNQGFLGFIIGILELISELARLISFSFRVFGNIFAGEVLIIVISFLTQFKGFSGFWEWLNYVGVPVTTLVVMMEVVVAMIQGYVFISLMTVFINLAMTSHDAHHDEPQSPKLEIKTV